ncbi:hypothetical protein FHT15_001619 [Xanthomonas campestris]
MDVLAACPAMVGGQGPRSKPAVRGRGALTAPDSVLIVLLKTMHTDHLDGSLPAHRRGTLSGMDAAPEPTRTYLRRVLRWWVGKGPAAKSQISRQATNLSMLSRPLKHDIQSNRDLEHWHRLSAIKCLSQRPSQWRARRGHRTRRCTDCFTENHAHRPSRLALARPPSRDLERHGCRARAYTDVLAACPAMVGGQGPCSTLAASRARCPHRLQDTP